jgi:hypothetical protein
MDNISLATIRHSIGKAIKVARYFSILLFCTACSKALNLTEGDKKISRNPYSGTDKETAPSDISGAWLAKCQVSELSKSTYQVQCRIESPSGEKYPKTVDVTYRQVNGGELKSIYTKQLPADNFYHFESKIEASSPIEVLVKVSDGTFAVKSVTILDQELEQASLLGMLTGVCGYQGAADSGCNLFQESMPNGSCPDGYIFAQMTSRFQGPEGSAIEGNMSGTCIFENSSSQKTLDNPKKYAYRGVAYGFCKTNADAKQCIDNSAKAPLNANNQCPDGFTIQQLSAHVDGNTNYRTFTCIANDTGPLAEPPKKGAILHVKPYNFQRHNDSDERERCPSGMEWTPLSGRYKGENEQWVSGCVVK